MKSNANNHQTQSSAGQAQKPLTGVWGGEGISMEVDGSRATLTFDCAHGSVSEAMTPNSDGKFEVKGFFVRERGGPTRREDTAEGLPARYSGVVSGDTLTLTIVLTETKESLGDFTLTRGKSGRLRRCA